MAALHSSESSNCWWKVRCDLDLPALSANEYVLTLDRALKEPKLVQAAHGKTVGAGVVTKIIK